MNNRISLASVGHLVSQSREFLFQHVLSWAMVAQVVVTGSALLLAYK